MLISFPKIIGCSESIINKDGYIEQTVIYGDYPYLIEPTKLIGKHLSVFKDLIEDFDFYYEILIGNIQQCDYFKIPFNLAGYRRIGLLVPINQDRAVFFHYCIDDSRGYKSQRDSPNKKAPDWMID